MPQSLLRAALEDRLTHISNNELHDTPSISATNEEAAHLSAAPKIVPCNEVKIY